MRSDNRGKGNEEAREGTTGHQHTREAPRRNQRQVTLERVEQMAGQSLDPKVVSDMALKVAMESLNLDTCLIRHLDEATGEMEMLANRGLSQEMAEAFPPRVKMGRGLVSLAAQGGASLVIDDIPYDPRTRLQPLRRWGLETYVTMPLKVDGRIVGVMSGFSRLPRTLIQADVEMLSSLGSAVATAIASARLHPPHMLSTSMDLDTVLSTPLEHIDAPAGSQERATLESIISSMGNGLLVVDPQGAVVYYSSGLERVLDMRASDLLGRPVELFSSALASRLLKPGDLATTLARELRDVDGPLKLRFRLQREKGQEVESTIFPIEGGSGRLGAGAMFQEASREREMDWMKMDFIALASHELRTPMAVVGGFIQLLMAREVSPQEQREWLGWMYQETQRLTNILDDLLNVSKIEAGGVLPRPGPVSLDALVTPLIDRFRPRYPSHSYISNVPAELPEVWADEERMTEVLYNLLENASKYSPQGGPVEVSARWDELRGQALIGVTDRGLGIPSSEMPNLFTRFHHIYRPETESLRGTGLGLYIVKSLVNMMGGEVWAESRENEGSTFYFTLPRA